MEKIDFSVITAVYNTAEFIDEAVQSVIDQTVGIDRIELILVNDASTDNSLEICRKWETLYPGNIKVIDQGRNQGVSAARNAGMKIAKGKYVSFMDSDDKFTPNVCESVERFFTRYAAEPVDVVALPIIYFDGETGPHPLNDKFEKGTRVIDLDKEWQFAQNFISSTFVSAEALQNHLFDTQMPLSEDLKFVQELILRTHKLGVISETQYLYRRRTSGQESAIQGKESKRVWYVPTLRRGMLELFNQAKNQANSVPRYLQFLIMYDMQWRLRAKSIECTEMTDAERKEYYELVQCLLREVDDEVIMCQKYIAADTKAYAKLMKRNLPVSLVNLCRKTRIIKLLKPLL